MPPRTGRLSIYMVDGLQEAQIWYIARIVVAPALGATVLGRADLNSLRVYEQNLRVEPSPLTHPRHADIVGWDLVSTETRLIAIKLAAASRLRLLP